MNTAGREQPALPLLPRASVLCNRASHPAACQPLHGTACLVIHLLAVLLVLLCRYWTVGLSGTVRMLMFWFQMFLVRPEAAGQTRGSGAPGGARLPEAPGLGRTHGSKEETHMAPCLTTHRQQSVPPPHAPFLQANVASVSMFQLVAAVARDDTIATAIGAFLLLVFVNLSGFILNKNQIRGWWIWA